MKQLASLAIVLGLTGCLRSTAYTCTDNAACGTSGTCESTGYCSAPDGTCNGNRYGDSAGPYAGQCVTGLVADAAGGSGSGSGGADAKPSRCPVDFLPLAGGAGNAHVYKVMQPIDSWDHWFNTCNGIDHAYLAVPDDAAELSGLALLSTPPTWIGIGRVGQVWLSSKDGSLVHFLPWTGSTPDGGQGKDCVRIDSATTIENDTCATKHAGICECEP